MDRKELRWSSDLDWRRDQSFLEESDDEFGLYESYRSMREEEESAEGSFTAWLRRREGRRPRPSKRQLHPCCGGSYHRLIRDLKMYGRRDRALVRARDEQQDLRQQFLDYHWFRIPDAESAHEPFVGYDLASEWMRRPMPIWKLSGFASQAAYQDYLVALYEEDVVRYDERAEWERQGFDSEEEYEEYFDARYDEDDLDRLVRIADMP